MRHESQSGPDSVIRLKIEGDDLRFSVIEHFDAGEGRRVSAGPLTQARSMLRHEPATAAELEAVIAEIEDLIIPVIRTLPPAGVLEMEGRALYEVAEALPSAGEGPIPIRDVEHLFSRLANVAMGSPAASQGVPDTATFALGLVVLREVMHHGGYDSVVRRPRI